MDNFQPQFKFDLTKIKPTRQEDFFQDILNEYWKHYYDKDFMKQYQEYKQNLK